MPYSRTPLGEIVKKINDATGVCEELVDSNGASLSSVFLTPPQVALTQALVSEAGNMASADLSATVGTLGQTVRLTDGENRGAVLMWSTPAGSSTPAWCWWLWPQAAY
jgi:hypothetical protein